MRPIRAAGPLMVTFKPSVRMHRLTPALHRMLDVLFTVDGSLPWLPTDLVVTSINDSHHGMGSRHYTDEAIDVRSHSFASLADRYAFRRLLIERLGESFTVLLEDEGQSNEHFHVQVRKGTTFP